MAETTTEKPVDLTDRKIPKERSTIERTHFVYWNGSRCNYCGEEFKHKSRGLYSNRQDCPDAPDDIKKDGHDFIRGDRGSLTTWNHQPAPDAKEVIGLTDKQWIQLLEFSEY